MRTIKKKLNSQRGASLTFALLLFLVCAVVGSVVLVAGTAASGRLAGLADYEQRFYAVNSAAELLAEEITKGEVIFEKTKEEKITTTWKSTIVTFNNEDEIITDEVISDKSSTVEDTYFFNTSVSPDSLSESTTGDFLQALAQKIVFKEEMTPASAWNITGAVNQSFSFKISAGTSADEIPEVKVDATYNASSRELELIMYNDTATAQYKLKMTLAPEYYLRFPEPQQKEQPGEVLSSEPDGDDSTRWTRIETNTYYSTCVVKWKVSGITIEEGE